MKHNILKNVDSWKFVLYNEEIKITKCESCRMSEDQCFPLLWQQVGAFQVKQDKVDYF